MEAFACMADTYCVLFVVMSVLLFMTIVGCIIYTRRYIHFLKSWCNKTSVLLTFVMYVFLIIIQLYFPYRLEWKLEIHANLKVSSWVLILDKIIKHVTKGNYYNRLKEHIQDYGMATTIGGIHYFTSNRRGTKER